DVDDAAGGAGAGAADGLDDHRPVHRGLALAALAEGHHRLGRPLEVVGDHAGDLVGRGLELQPLLRHRRVPGRLLRQAAEAGRGAGRGDRHRALPALIEDVG
ncbi:MAG: hypothetical protein ACK559_17725, partial [bacterium]